MNSYENFDNLVQPFHAFCDFFANMKGLGNEELVSTESIKIQVLTYS